VHPCVSLSAKFFGVDLKDFLKEVVPPALIAFVISLALSLILNV